MKILDIIKTLFRQKSKSLSNLFSDRDREILQTIIKGNLILDLGGGSPWKSGWIHEMYGPTLREKGLCMDINKDKKPHIAGDIMQLPFKDSVADTIICNAVLEHIPRPQDAIREISRVLKPEGNFFFYLPWMYPYHGGPHDYYRFSSSSIDELFKDFSEYHVIARGTGSLRVALGFLVGYQEPLHSILTAVIAKPAEMLMKLFISFLKKTGRCTLAKQLELYLSPNIAHGYFVYGSK